VRLRGRARAGPGLGHPEKGRITVGDSVYKIIEIVGTSETSWEDATTSAVATAAKTLRDLRVAEVVEQDATINEDGTIDQFRVRLSISFKYQED
jgi:flavin-binding protein dodecin